VSDTENLEGSLDSEAEITLGVLTAVHASSSVTQRSMAQQLGIALGLANAYLKRCAKKGLIKVSQVPPNRYAYYLTPQGFAEKSRLTADYLSGSFRFFRRAREQCGALIAECEANAWHRIALYGASELAEIATLCRAGSGVDLAGVVDPHADGNTIGDYRVVRSLDDLGPVDAVLLTDLRGAQAAYDALSARLPENRILVPAMLGVTRGAGE